MATISNTLKMKDSMGSVLKNVITSMDMTISTMERLNSTSDSLDLSGDFEAARQQIGLTRNDLSLIDDEIKRASEEQDKFNNKLKEGTFLTKGLSSMLAGLGGLIGIKKLAGTSDEMIQIDARLNLLTNSEAEAEVLKKQIFASANDARGLYTDMASSITKLGLLAGDAFGNTDEIVAFTNTFQKMGIVSGSSSSEVSNAMYQLNQAMASGRLQGDEFRSIIENAPMLAQAIADYAGIGRDELKKLSSDGLITADIIKGAMFSVADEVNKQFASMPMTWGQVWNGVVNKLLMWSEPLLGFINVLANNWSIIEPIVLGVAAAVLIYTMVTKGAAAATATWVAVQAVFNAVMGLNPIAIAAMVLVLFISLIYAGVAAMNKFTESSVSATGIIAGSFMWLLALIGNLFIATINGIIQYLWTRFVEPFIGIIEWVLNAANGGFNSFGDAVANLIGQIISWFLSLGKVVTKIIDAIFGSNWTAGLSSLQDSVLSWGKNENAITISRDAPAINHRFDYGNAWDTGYKFGEGIENKISGMFGLDGLGFDVDNLVGGLKDEEFNVNVKDDINLADESLKYLLDAVTQKYINEINLQTPAPSVHIEFTGEINRDVDLDELAEKTKQKIGTEMVEYVMSSTDIIH